MLVELRQAGCMKAALKPTILYTLLASICVH